MLPILFAAYGAVFVAEIAGDKLLYTTGVLAARYRTAPILCGMAIAFMAKMGVAVLVGRAVSKLPPLVVAAMTTVNFFAIAYALWRKSDGGESKTDYPASRAMMVSFAAIFFSEWGDLGQVTAATLAARFGLPLAVWVGAVGAMVTKGALAAYAGAGVRQWIQQRVSPKTVRYVAVAVLLLLGLLSVAETLSNPRIAPDPEGTEVASLFADRTGVPSATKRQISSISSFVTAMQPSVQSNKRWAEPIQPWPLGRPWIMISPPGSTRCCRARSRSASPGYEIRSDL